MSIHKTTSISVFPQTQEVSSLKQTVKEELSFNIQIAKVLKLEETTKLVQDVAGIIASYLIDIFGAKEWEYYYGGYVKSSDLSYKYYTWALSSDAIEPDKINWETHLPPVLRPEQVNYHPEQVNLPSEQIAMTESLSIPLIKYSLRKLEFFVKNPKVGPKSQYFAPYSTTLRVHGNIEAGSARWLVMRKNPFARNQTFDQQKEYIQKLNASSETFYDEMPSALDLATVVYAMRSYTGGDRYLGDSTGKEGCKTFSRCREHMRDKVSVIIGDFNNLGALSVTSQDSGAMCNHIAVAGICGFQEA